MYKEIPLGHTSIVSLENSIKTDNFSKLSKKQIVLTIIGRVTTNQKKELTNRPPINNPNWKLYLHCWSSYLLVKFQFCFKTYVR